MLLRFFIAKYCSNVFISSVNTLILLKSVDETAGYDSIVETLALSVLLKYDDSKVNVYVGYWSFEVGAIAKIFDISDDITWKYYPYDLVHTD